MELKTRNARLGALLARAVAFGFSLMGWVRSRTASHSPTNAIADINPAPQHATPAIPASQPSQPLLRQQATNNSGKQFITPRYDSSRVIFLDSATEDALDPKLVERLPKLKPAIAELAGLDNLYEVDADFEYQHPQLFKITQTGEQWQLQISAGSTAQVVTEKPVIAMLGCMVAGGFLARVTPQDEQRFSSSPQQCFLISHAQNTASTTVVSPRVGELNEWKADSETDARIRELLEATMRQELAKVRATMAPEYDRAEDGNSGWVQEWKKRDEQLADGKGKLTYKVQAFQLMSDGIPRLYIRRNPKALSEPNGVSETRSRFSSRHGCGRVAHWQLRAFLARVGVDALN